MKKLLSYALILTLAISLIVPMAAAAAAVTRFPDVAENRWSYPYIELLAEKGIVEGMPDGTFGPTRNVSNAEFITLVVRSTIGELPETPNPKHWAERYINAAFSAGIVLDGELTADAYDNPISRQSMARMMMRALKEPEEQNTERFTSKIKDWAETCEPCKPYVAQAYAKGIITGVDGYFLGARHMTLEEACTIIVRMIDKDYRYIFIDGVAFNPKTDVTADGLMKLTAAERFIMKALDTLKFYKEDGKYYFTVTLPETPDGFDMSFRVETNPGNGYTTNALLPERMIPSKGTITKELVESNRYMPQVFQKGTIQVLIGVTATPKQALVTHQDGHANLLAIYENNKLERFSTALVVTNGAASAKSSTDMQLRFSDYFSSDYMR